MAEPVAFSYEGVDRSGRKLQGEIAGKNLQTVRAELRKQGIRPVKVNRKRAPLKLPGLGGGGKIKPGDIAVFSRQMATMMKAGVPLVQSFDIVADGLDKPLMRNLIRAVRDDVSSGNAFAASLAKHPQYFDDLYCNLVEAGEQSGALETMLDRIATYKEKTESLKAKIRKAMTYPAAVIAIAIIVSGILLIKVVPQFEEIFRGFGADLPAFTLWVIGISEIVQDWWFFGLLGLAAAGYAFSYAYKRSPRLRNRVDELLLKLPIAGDIITKSAVARFCRTLATTFAAGVPLVEALRSVSGATGNVVYRRATDRIADDVASGTQLNFSMRSTGVWPNMVLQMVSIGEESGALDEMLDKAASYYEEEVDNAVDSLTELMEPMIMSILGVLVGGLIIAMYLPIFQLGAVIG